MEPAEHLTPYEYACELRGMNGMANTPAPTARRVFTGEKDNGEKFAILYQPKGVQWVFGEEARRFYNAVARPPRPEGRDAAAAGRAAPHGEAQSQAGGDMSATEAVAGALNAADRKSVV